MSNATASEPIVEIQNTNADNAGAELRLRKESASAANDDVLGNVIFQGKNTGASPSLHNFARIQGVSTVVTGAGEMGKIALSVEVSGTLTEMLTLDGNGETLLLTSATASKPEFEIKNTNADATPPIFRLRKDSASPAASDALGRIDFDGDASNNSQITFARLQGISVAVDHPGGDVRGGIAVSTSSGVGTLTERFRFSNRNLLVGTTTITGSDGAHSAIVFGDASSNPTMGSNTAAIYAKDVSGTVEMFAIDESGNATQLSPHNPDTGEYWFNSVNEKHGKKITIHMERMLRELDKMLGGGFIEETLL